MDDTSYIDISDISDISMNDKKSNESEKFDESAEPIKITVIKLEETRQIEEFSEVNINSGETTPLFSLSPSVSPMALSSAAPSPKSFEEIQAQAETETFDPYFEHVQMDPDCKLDPHDVSGTSAEEAPEQIESKFEEARSRYQFRQTPARMKSQRHPPDISGNDLKGVCGIANMGNTCYANSCLQILRAAGDWSVFLLSNDLVGDKSPIPDQTTKESKILIGYQDMLRVLWSATLPAFIRPLGWLGVVREAVKGSVYEMFSYPIPNDSHEYLVWLLDNFHEALLKKPAGTAAAAPSTGSSAATTAAPPYSGDPWLKFLAQNNTQMAKSFYGLLHKDICCSRCSRHSITYEPFNVLKIPCLDPNRPFSEWIQNYFASEELEDYACEGCSPTRTKAIIKHSLWRAPRNLFISVRRFAHDGRKNNMTVPTEGTENIDIRSVYNPKVVSAGPIMSKYSLRGVVDHHGSHMGGHYTAQFYHPVSNHWWWIDDEAAQFIPQPKFGSSNYIFLFRQNGVDKDI